MRKWNQFENNWINIYLSIEGVNFMEKHYWNRLKRNHMSLLINRSVENKWSRNYYTHSEIERSHKRKKRWKWEFRDKLTLESCRRIIIEWTLLFLLVLLFCWINYNRYSRYVKQVTCFLRHLNLLSLRPVREHMKHFLSFRITHKIDRSH